jgi:hypothetical protein
MKKIIAVVFAVCFAAAVLGCASKPPASGGMPSFNLANARRNAPEDVLVGIGNAKMGTVAQSRNIAATRARAEISNSLDSIVKNMVRDYTASSEVDPNAALAFQESITVTLSKSNLSGAVIQFEEPDSSGEWWVVMYLSKANAAKEITQAQTAARLAVPTMASFDAEERMNEAFEQTRTEGW